MMRCPTCGSLEVYRSRRAWFERIFNWLFWYHQRPYRCSTCLTRYWVRLEPRVWRHTLKTRAIRVFRAWGLYVGALLLAAIVAWSMNYISQQAQRGGNALIDAAIEQGLQDRLDGTDLTDEQKEKAKEFFENYQE